MMHVIRALSLVVLFVVFMASAQEVAVNSIGMELIEAPAGTFVMGAENGDWDEVPTHPVEISHRFLVSSRKVSLEQYRQFKPDHAHGSHNGDAVAVSWRDAVAFCDWLSAKEGRPYRLPTEAEWEHACRLNGGGPGDRISNAITVSDAIDIAFDGFQCHVYSRAYPAGDIVLGGNDRAHTGSPGTFIALVVPTSPTAEVSVVRTATDRSYALLSAEPGVKPYADRDYAITALDDRLRGGRLVQTHVIDEDQAGEAYLVLQASEPVVVYLIFNADTESLPSWMAGYSAHGDEAAQRPLLARSTPGALGLVGMCDETAEWCLDWYGPYSEAPQTDPVGAELGMARVVRGNKIDANTRFMLPHSRGYYYQRSSNRAGMPPGFGPANAVDEFGRHRIGFRVVQAPLPGTSPQRAVRESVTEGVKEGTHDAARAHGPDSATPYFRKRYLLPSPPETIQGFERSELVEKQRSAIAALALHPSFAGHNHSPALEVMPNGDLLMVIFTSWNEYEPDMALMATRLRFGADQWDMPSPFVDMPDACDNTPLLWTDGEVVRLFWSTTHAIGAFPFQWIESRDSGATWSEVQFPTFVAPVGPHSRQPINTVVRDGNGVVYLPSDGVGASSVVWRSRDNLLTWEDPGGRTGGRHTTFALLQDGTSLLGMGGKSSDIEGYMPQSISRDGGKSWEVSRTPFPTLGSNQRPCVLRLASGRLFFCGDFQHYDGTFPPGVSDRGSYVALSDDDGSTWHIKKLVGTQPHENPKHLGGFDTLGYSVARQAQDGLVHLITTMNKPCLHFAFNEAWILSADESIDESALMANSATSVAGVRRYEERHPNGEIRVAWGAGIADDGRYLLDGDEIWYGEDGGLAYRATWALGEKRGEETLFSESGTPLCQWHHGADGTGEWTQWWADGAKKSCSHWRGAHADGRATRWDRAGAIDSEVDFVMGATQP